MTLFASAKNAAANAIPIDQISLHSGEPGDGTANELPAGVYARKAIAFGAAVNGVRNQSADVLLDVPSESSVSHFVLWGGGVAQKKGAFAQTETYAAQGQHRVKAGTVTITG